MHLQGSLQNFVGDGGVVGGLSFARLVDPHFTRCIEIESNIETRAATAKEVHIPDENLETWLDEAIVYHEQGDMKKRRLHLFQRLEHRTPFTNEALQNAVNLARGSKGLIIRMEGHNERILDAALMVAINKSCTQTCAVLRIYKTDSLNSTLEQIDHLKQYLWHPCMLVSIRIDARLSKIGRNIREYNLEIRRMEETAGVYGVSLDLALEENERGIQQPWSSEHFDSLRHELASVKNSLRYMTYKCVRLIRLLDFLDNLALELEDLPEYRIRSKFLRSTVDAYDDRARYLIDRAETTLQTCFSFMSQKDNYLNQQSATQALELTNLSRIDNAHMKQIATAAYRDSRDMRAITIITLFFLPGTTVATFFGTSFFDFSQSGRMTSGWLWIYFLVTGILTMGVMGGWFYFSRASDITSRAKTSSESGENERKLTV